MFNNNIINLIQVDGSGVHVQGEGVWGICSENCPQPGPLPLLPSDSWYSDYAGQVATVTGWGNTASAGSPSNTLQEVQVTVISNQDCSEAYDQINR